MILSNQQSSEGRSARRKSKKEKRGRKVRCCPQEERKEGERGQKEEVFLLRLLRARVEKAPPLLSHSLGRNANLLSRPSDPISSAVER